MSWLIQTLSSSVGKKLLMAVTGLCFIGFLAAHLAGNLTIYAGGAAFNSYAEKLHSMGPILTFFELGLLLFALIHVITGITLFLQNMAARSVILGFVVFHLINFSFVDKTDQTIFEIVRSAFASPIYMIIYVLVMIIVAVHVRHGFWSALQTLGANHPKYMPALMVLSVVVGLIIGFGFGLLPIYVWTMG